ncbi:MAG: CDP-alcohol phosphatidyltransferase family protein [Acidobacteria bacterium]|nr:CDP-alcohol phosphatidyltransferase family protein [Acidobacteriota bacterium]
MSQRPVRIAGSHTRENTGLLAAAEKRTLVWIATRLPSGIHSDHLSSLGLVAMAAAGVSFAFYPLSSWAVVGVLVALAINWFGDSLDGTVARVRNQQRPRYGFYVDHVIDLAGTTFLLGGLACSGLMSPLPATLALAGFLLVSAETYLATHAAGVFRMSFMGIGPTELRILIAIGAIRAAVNPWVTFGESGAIRLFDLGALIGAVGMFVVFAISAVRNTIALSAADPRPERSHG